MLSACLYLPYPHVAIVLQLSDSQALEFVLNAVTFTEILYFGGFSVLLSHCTAYTALVLFVNQIIRAFEGEFLRAFEGEAVP